MSIFDEAQARLSNKRFERLQTAKQKQKLDTQKYPYATYQGKDPNDGTDIVQVGANEPVSGFRLISNAPMAIGDRVALRKNNQGGLQRVDDRNVSISNNNLITNQKLIEAVYVRLQLYASDFVATNGFYLFEISKQVGVDVNPAFAYFYNIIDNKQLLSKTQIFNTGNTVLSHFNNTGSSLDNIPADYELTGNGLIELTTDYAISTPTVIALFDIRLKLVSSLGLKPAEVESEIVFNGTTITRNVTVSALDRDIFITNNISGQEIELPSALTQYTVFCRFRKRGASEWFTL